MNLGEREGREGQREGGRGREGGREGGEREGDSTEGGELLTSSVSKGTPSYVIPIFAFTVDILSLIK